MKENNNENEILETITFIKDLGMMYPTESSKRKYRFGIYKCGYCDKEFRAQTSLVKTGNTKSCGCYNKRRIKETNTKHGLGSTKLYRVWANIKDRTLNTKTRDYYKYGSRGIGICEEWKNDFKAFYDWSILNGYEEDKDLSIDRIDNDGNYEPNNCRWVNRTIQSRNQGLRKDNTTGYKGVKCIKENEKYQARITINYKSINLGRFQTAVEAAIAYNNYIIENNLEGFILNVINLTQEM